VNLNYLYTLVQQGQLLFFQLPACMPEFVNPSSLNRDADGDETMDTATAEEENGDTPRDRLEGRIGNLVIHKSGKIKLKMGSITLDVRSCFLPSFIYQ
jgi:DNA-directed RNA polymerase III subunit RPC4